MTERRYGNRKSVHTRVFLMSRDRPRRDGTVRNLSESGTLVDTSLLGLAPGLNLTVVFAIDFAGVVHLRRLPARVVRFTREGVALEFQPGRKRQLGARGEAVW